MAGSAVHPLQLVSIIIRVIVCAVLPVIACLPPAAFAQPKPEQTARPCAFAATMRDIHMELITLGVTIHNADITAARIHHTSIRYPYKSIERAWSYVTTHTDPLLDRLTDLQIALDAARDDRQKQAALDLITAYQHTLDADFEYMRFITYYERTENALSKYTTVRASQYTLANMVSFGVVQDLTRSGGDNSAKDLLTEKATLLIDASLSLKLPEYHYAHFCHTTFPNEMDVNAVRMQAASSERRHGVR